MCYCLCVIRSLCSIDVSSIWTSNKSQPTSEMSLIDDMNSLIPLCSFEMDHFGCINTGHHNKDVQFTFDFGIQFYHEDFCCVRHYTDCGWTTKWCALRAWRIPKCFSVQGERLEIGPIRPEPFLRINVDPPEKTNLHNLASRTRMLQQLVLSAVKLVDVHICLDYRTLECNTQRVLPGKSQRMSSSHFSAVQIDILQSRPTFLVSG